MSKAVRRPMTFAVAPEGAAPSPAPARLPRAETTERQQVGARVTKATYRQLKARAALTGQTVQALVEKAIEDYLANNAAT